MTPFTKAVTLAIVGAALAGCGVRGALVPPQDIPAEENADGEERSRQGETRFPAPVPVE